MVYCCALGLLHFDSSGPKTLTIPAKYLSCLYSSRKNLFTSIILQIDNAVLLYYFDRHALEINWQASLQFVCAHAQNLEALVE